MYKLTAPRNIHKRWIAFLIVSSVLLTVLVMMTPQQTVSAESMQFAVVERGNLPQKIQGFGKFIALDNQLLTSPFHGTVEKVHYRTGDVVKKGAVILELINHDVQRLLQEAEMDYSQAILAGKRALLDWEQRLQQQQGLIQDLAGELSIQQLESSAKQRLFQQNIISVLEMQRAKVQLTQASENHQRAVQELARLQQQKQQSLLLEENSAHLALQRLNSRRNDAERLQVRAPFSGKLDNLHVTVGQAVLQGDTFVAIKGESEFALRARVPQRYASQVKIGQHAVFELGKSTEGVIRTIFPGVRQGFIEVELTVPANLEGVQEDLELPVAIITGMYQDALYVKKPEGLVHSSKIPLFVKDGDMLRKVEVVAQDILDSYVILAPQALALHTQVLISDSTLFQTQSLLKIGN